MKGRGSCVWGGKSRGQTELNVCGGKWGGWEVKEERRPVRMSAFQAIVHGNVVGKMHKIVSRCQLYTVKNMLLSKLWLNEWLFSGTL